MRFQSSTRRISRPFIPFDRAQFRAGVNAAQREMGKVAEELTGGTVPESVVKRARSFSRLNPNNLIPKLPINAHTKQLQKSLRIVRRVVGNLEQLFLRSNHLHALVLRKEGLKNMVPRGFFEEFGRRTKGILRDQILRALRKK